MPTDEELLKSFAGGDRHALGALAERYERPLLGLARAILGADDLAVDAVQETWLRVIRYAKGFNGRSSAKTWLYRIAINQCRNLLSARPVTAGEEVDATTGTGPEATRGEDDRADAGNDPADQVVWQDEAERLKRAVEGLSAPLREAVLLCYTHGLTHDEAAEAMGIPVGTVKSRVHAALEELRGRLRPR